MLSIKKLDSYGSRIDFVDMAKGTAMICIILGHFYGGCYPMLGKIIYPFHVPIFFLITGYFLKNVDFCQAPQIFIRKKAKVLLFPYICSCVLMIVISIGQDLITKEFRDIMINVVQLFCSSIYGGGAKGALYPNGFKYNWIGVLWFLMAVFQASVLMYLIIHFTNNKILQIFFVLAIFIVGLLIVKYIPYQMPFVFTSGMTTLIYVYTGYLISKVNIKNINYRYYLGIQLTGIVGWFFAVQYQFAPVCSQGIYGKGIGTIVATIICSMLSSAAVIIIMRCYSNLSERPGLLEYIGRNSIIIMCVHAIELRVINWTRFFNFLSVKFKINTTFKEQMLFRIIFIGIASIIVINVRIYIRKRCKWNV